MSDDPKVQDAVRATSIPPRNPKIRTMYVLVIWRDGQWEWQGTYASRREPEADIRKQFADCYCEIHRLTCGDKDGAR